MSIVQQWQNQKDDLRSTLTERMSAADVVRHVRHALLQVEQNALAEMGDDLLRQQASVLMGSLKGSVGLLEAHGTTQIWVAQKNSNGRASGKMLWQIAVGALAAAAVWCGFRDEWLAMALTMTGLAIGLCALFTERKENASVLPKDKVQATITVDIDRLFAILDGQLRSMDRYLSDFSYLNDQARGSAESTDPITLSRAADLMEALYDCDETERAPAEEAARRLLENLGLQAVDYCEEQSKLFNALPSKSITRTLSPAIVSSKDQQLLRRGTAAVRINAA